jgi:hypothetical protein
MTHMNSLTSKLQVLAMALVPFTLISQISITENDILSLKGTTRDVLVPDGESDRVVVPIGPGGMDQVWDYQSVNIDNFITGEAEYQDPDGGFRADLFPTANFRQRISAELEEGQFLIDSYWDVSSSELRILGSAGSFIGFANIEIEQENVAPLPLTFGTTWLAVSRDTMAQIGFVTITIDSSWNTVDGHGMLLLPTGDFECLRLRDFNKTISITTFNGMPFGMSDTTESVNYTWISKAHLQTFGIDSIESNVRFSNGMGEVTQMIAGEVSPVLAATGDLPKDFVLEQNYPNPFYPVTTIRFDIPQETHVVLSIHDLVGREVIKLVDEMLPSGSYTQNWYADGIPNGVYIYRLRAGNHIEMQKMTLMR